MHRALLVGLLVVLGGVGGATGPSTATAQADEPTGNATAELPPGLSPDGVDDPFALAQAHNQRLRNVSYTMSTTFSFRRPNGTLIGHGSTTARVAAGGERFHTVRSQANRNATGPLGVVHFTVERYGDGDRTLSARTASGGTPTYRNRTGDGMLLRPGTGWEGMYTAFSSVNTTVTDRWERNDTTLYRVVSTSQPDSASALADGGGYSMAAVVDEDGVVRRFHESRRATFDGEPAIYTRTVHVTRVGNTTVERPDWYPQAVANATGE